MATKLAPLAALSVVLAAALGAYVVSPHVSTPGPDRPWTDRQPQGDDQSSRSAATMTTFDSAEEFSRYLWTARMRTGSSGSVRFGAGGAEPVEVTMDAESGAPARTGWAGGEAGGDGTAGSTVSGDAGGAPAVPGGGPGGAGDPGRYSGTNVQEAGIHEPDVVKTDGNHIYYSSTVGIGAPREATARPAGRDDEPRSGGRSGKESRKGSEPPPGETRVIDATPPGTAGVAARIEHSGRLFLVGDRLVVVGEKLWGYDVTDPSDPELTWTRDIRESVETARVREGTLYLVLASRVDPRNPCPTTPLEGTDVACTEIYHPDRPVPVDVTYTAVTLDPDSGDVGDEVSFVGSRAATVYMSDGGLYATYTEETPRALVRLDFLLSEARPLLADTVVSRLERIRGYDLSPRATGVEVRHVLQQWFRSLGDDRREELQETLREGYRSYIETRRRTLTTTHVVRIETNSSTDGGAGGQTDGEATGLSIGATGAVPGRPLDQFSLDEHEGHLRIATTVGGRGGTESVNDVYVLDAATLSVTGSVTGMGETERIYAVRFVGDRGYVVTFRRVDPFHVLDLSDPSDPRMTGKLKLPGYSSYLHPLPGDRVLGIGEADGEVKTVIFDVSDPSNPTIEASRVLGADWSAVSRSHHAFLLDEKHGVFFLPTERGGAVLSSTTLETVHTVDVADPRRALYIEDFLYVFGRDEVAVVNETTWTRADTLALTEDGRTTTSP